MGESGPAKLSQPREALLLLACAQVSPAPAQVETIRSAVAAGVDWPVVLRLAEAHGLLALLFRGIGLAGCQVPRDVELRLWTYQEQLRRKNEFMLAELLRILDLLEGAGIVAIPYKGPVLAMKVYGNLELREFGDLDLLLPPVKIKAASDLLKGLGYGPLFKLSPSIERALLASPGQYHLALKHLLMVELHWSTDAEFPAADLSDEAWWRRRPTIELAGRHVRGLDEDELVFALMLHGSKHLWEQVNWLGELAELLRCRPALDWPRVLGRAEQLGAKTRLAVGLWLLKDCFHAALPDTVQAWMNQQSSAPEIASFLSSRWFPTGEPTPATGFERLRLNLKLYDSAGQGMRHVTRVLRPGFEEWRRWPLPRALHVLYLPMRAVRLAAKHLRPRPAD